MLTMTRYLQAPSWKQKKIERKQIKSIVFWDGKVTIYCDGYVTIHSMEKFMELADKTEHWTTISFII